MWRRWPRHRYLFLAGRRGSSRVTMICLREWHCHIAVDYRHHCDAVPCCAMDATPESFRRTWLVRSSFIHVEQRIFLAVGRGICEMIVWIMSLCVISAWIVCVLWKSCCVSGKVTFQARDGSQLMGLRRDDALRHRRRAREKMDFAIFVSDWPSELDWVIHRFANEGLWWYLVGRCLHHYLRCCCCIAPVQCFVDCQECLMRTVL